MSKEGVSVEYQQPAFPEGYELHSEQVWGWGSLYSEVQPEQVLVCLRGPGDWGLCTWGLRLGPCMVETPPPPANRPTDRHTRHKAENITFATPLADGNDVDNDPRLRSIHSEGNQPW